MSKRVFLLLFLLLGGIIIYLNASLLGMLEAIWLGQNSFGSQPFGALESQRTATRLALIYQSENEHYWTMVKEGALATAEVETSRQGGESGVYLRVFESSHTSQFDLEDSLRLAILASYDGVIIHAEDDAIIPLIREAGEAGIPVIVVGSDLPGSGRVSYVGTNNYRAGFAAGKAMLKALQSDVKGPLAILSASSGRDRLISAAESLKVFGFREAVSAVQEGTAPIWQKCEPTILESTATVRDMMSEHPDIKGIYSTHAGGTVAAAKVVIEKGLVGKVKIVGFGDLPEIREYISMGVVQAAVVEYPYQIGVTAVREMLLYLREGWVNVFNNIDGLILTQENLSGL